MTNETKTYRITRVGVEATQRGYVVTVGRKGHPDGDLAYFHCGGSSREIDAAYRSASACAESVKRGRYVGRRDGFVSHVRGKTLTVSEV